MRVNFLVCFWQSIGPYNLANDLEINLIFCFCIVLISYIYCFSQPSDECFDDIQAIVQQWKAVETANDSQSKFFKNKRKFYRLLLTLFISYYRWRQILRYANIYATPQEAVQQYFHVQ